MMLVITCSATKSEEKTQEPNQNSTETKETVSSDMTLESFETEDKFNQSNIENFSNVIKNLG